MPSIATAIVGRASRAVIGLDVKMFAVPGALLWGVGLAFGLVLRDGDARQVAALADQRQAERMRIARELHDFVTHHVTGIAVRARAAQVVAARSPSEVDHGQAYEEIQEAASASLTAMRRMVGMLRADEDTSPTPPTGIRAVLADVVGPDPRVTIEVTDVAAAPVRTRHVRHPALDHAGSLHQHQTTRE
jgi:signal transduction histidine kinase